MGSMFSKLKKACTVTVLAMALPLSAMAQAYLPKPIKMIVPFPAGGTTDIVARIHAQKIAESKRQSASVDTKGRSGGKICVSPLAQGPTGGLTY